MESGAYYAERWDQAVRDLAFREKTKASTYLETYAAVEACISFGKRGDRILYHGDNKGMVDVANRGYSKNRHILALLHRLFHFCAVHGVSVRFVFVTGRSNFLADHLSCGRIQAFLSAAPMTSFRTTPRGTTPLWT